MHAKLVQQVNGLSDVEQEGIEAIVNSMMELIEPIIRHRCVQWLKFIKEQTK